MRLVQTEAHIKCEIIRIGLRVRNTSSIVPYLDIFGYIHISFFFWKNYFHFAICVSHFFGIEGFEVKPHENRTVWVIRRRLVPTVAQNKKGLSSRVSLRDTNGFITCSFPMGNFGYYLFS